jgi:phosphatidylglycerol:prolipoprotein diacylglycerol transferase
VLVRGLLRSHAGKGDVTMPLAWLVVVGVAVFHLRPIGLGLYGWLLTVLPGVTAGLLLSRLRRLRPTKQWDLGVTLGVLAAVAGYLGYGQSLGLRIYGYGTMLVLGFLSGIQLARWRAGRFGEEPDHVTTLGLLALVGGVVGARLAFVVERWNSQFSKLQGPKATLLEVINITSGGLIYYGGAMAAILVMLAYLRLRRLPIRRYMDIIAPSLMIGLAFGRMGCLLNGCCYGGRCREDFSLGMRFPYAAKPVLNLGTSPNLFGGAPASPVFVHQVATPREKGGLGEAGVPAWLLRRGDDQQVRLVPSGGAIIKAPSELTAEQAGLAAKLRSLPVQPAQVFGVVNALLIACILLGFSRLRRHEGEVFALMLILYPVTRFVLEGIRGDNLHDVLHLELTHNQYTSIGMMAVGLLLWCILRRLPAGTRTSGRERPVAAVSKTSRPPRQRKGKR